MGIGALLATSFLVGLSGAMMPGGLLIVNINETIKKGLIGGLLVITGHALVEVVLVIGLALGLGSIFANEFFVGAIAVIGGGLLVWMAIDTAKASQTLEMSITQEESETTADRQSGPLFAGLLATISNPYWALWWTSVGAAYVAMAMEQGTRAVAAFYIGHVASDYAWYFLISLALVTGRKLISQKLYRGLLLVGSVFLAFLGLYCIWSGVTLLR